MRRNFRKKQQNDKTMIYGVAGSLVLLAIVFALLIYSNSLKEEENNSKLSSDQIASIVNNETNSESASSSIGRSIEEAEAKQNEENETNAITKNTTNSISSNSSSSNSVRLNSTNTTSAVKQTTATTAKKTDNNAEQNTTKTENTKEDVTENKKELSFQKPVEGDIVREYAKENLIYSETLQEWVTHDGIDIKAEKATVVQAAEGGTVKSIKNDPRYGLTIVIEHDNGFETIYANLLSSEFVTEGEKVEKGQSIGTVGNTAVFESVDETHLHFEILKDSVSVDPSIYLK